MIDIANNDSFSSLIQEALKNADTTGVENYLSKNPSTDVFAPLLDREISAQLFPVHGGLTLDQWLLQIDAWLDHVQDPRNKISTRDAILHLTWDHFATSLTNALRIGRLTSRIPNRGGVLAYVGHLAKCLIIEYKFAAAWPRFKPVAIVSDPQSAFDVYTAIDHADPSARNSLKAILASGHKLTAHRGVLIHVDKRKEAEVFGPSIDTLVMAEILEGQFFQPVASESLNVHQSPKVVLEIGTGSGFLSASLVRYLPNLQELFALDIDFSALACTQKNITMCRATPGAARQARLHLLCGSFDPTAINRRFDLIVCNPPYIPIPQDFLMLSEHTPNYFKAVAGLELLQAVLQATTSILAPQGRVLLMTSSVSWPGMQAFLPHGCHITKPLGEKGFEALFDVESVLLRPAWLENLLSKGGLLKRGDAYYHTLHPLLVTLGRKTEQ